ncbi:hypothetical protein MXB_5489, partial [Myxobolus squamalis]
SDLSEPPDYRSHNYLMAAFQLPSRNKLFEHIQQLCRNNATIENIDKPPISLISKDFPYLWHNAYGEFGYRYNRISILASNKGLVCTFRITMALFLQCLIVMEYNATSSIWAFISAKEEYLCCKVLHDIKISLKYRWPPKLVVVDFEKAFLNA